MKIEVLHNLITDKVNISNVLAFALSFMLKILLSLISLSTLHIISTIAQELFPIVTVSGGIFLAIYNWKKMRKEFNKK